MLQPYFKLDLLARALRGQGLQGSWRMAWQIMRSRWLYDWRYVYAMTAAQVDQLTVRQVPGHQIECLSSREQVVRLREQLRRHPRLLPDDPLRLHALGALFWVGRLDGELACLGAGRRGDPRSRYFFPLWNNVALLSHFGTVARFRGRGLYPALLGHILRQMRQTGVECFLIDCCDWNVASQRGIEHAGFRRIGCGKATLRGRLSWHPFDPSEPGALQAAARIAPQGPGADARPQGPLTGNNGRPPVDAGRSTSDARYARGAAREPL